MSAFTPAKSTGGFRKFGFPVILVTTAVPRVTTSASGVLEKPSNGRITFSFVFDIHSPIRFVRYRFWGEPLPAAKRKRDSLQPQETAGGFLTRLLACGIDATAQPNSSPEIEHGRFKDLRHSPVHWRNGF